MSVVMKDLLSPDEAKELGFISLAEAASLTGENRSTLWGKAETNQIANCLVKKGARPVC
jgi:hypothetical protein